MTSTLFPQITIWLIAKNEVDFIGETLHHLLLQSYPHNKLEIVFADGGSTDGTREIVEKVLSQWDISYKIINSRDLPLENGVNWGHSYQRNVVIDHASPKSEYIAWTDADCRVVPTWLEALYETIKNSDSEIAWAGWPRYVETEGNISKFELMLNYYFTSHIMSLGNPAYSDKTNVKYMSSIAWYNSIYKIEFLKKYRYSTVFPLNTDDNEINFRITQDGYKFLYCKWAVAYHRMYETIGSFLKKLIQYGVGSANMIKLHKKNPRIYVTLSLLYICGCLLTIPFLMLGGILWLITFVGWWLIVALATSVFFENISRTKSVQSLWVFLLVPLHPLMYGCGVVKELIQKRK